MNLDKRIIEGKRPLTCYDIEEAEDYVGKMCYICDEYDFFTKLTLTEKAILTKVEDCEVPFHYGSDKQGEFCIPAEWVKQEQKYRPYTDKEFLTLFDLGTFHSIRAIDKPYTRLVITGIYSKNDILYITIGNESGYGVMWLFKHCEYFNGEEWQPFGIKE